MKLNYGNSNDCNLFYSKKINTFKLMEKSWISSAYNVDLQGV